MKRLIDANALKLSHCKECSLYPDKCMDDDCDCGAIIHINAMPTVDAVPLDGSFLKMSKGDYLIYNRHWLYEHFDMEMDIQRSAMKSMGYEPALKDAEPVRHGKWIETDESDEWYGRLYKCSNCNTFVIGDMDNYCPFCGARMDEE